MQLSVLQLASRMFRVSRNGLGRHEKQASANPRYAVSNHRGPCAVLRAEAAS
jgi:hypothetical protein